MPVPFTAGLWRSGTTVRGAVSLDTLTRPAVGRGPQGTLGSLAEPEEASGRPRGRVSDRTMVRQRANERLASVRRIESRKRETMRKHPVPRTRAPHQISSPQPTGLIARAETAPESAASKCALDNHSHRTCPPVPAEIGLLGRSEPIWPTAPPVGQRGVLPF